MITGTPIPVGTPDFSRVAVVVANECGYARASLYSDSLTEAAEFAQLAAKQGDVVYVYNTTNAGERHAEPFGYFDVVGYHAYSSTQAQPCACYLTRREFDGDCPAHPWGIRPVSVSVAR